ncbi:hypothetical protein HDU98_007280 [Podochytrium sp. JEL0797]|nr:hypothetical protein HDU98_007280 [Podochytrium sp. JEL0797]
MIKNPLVTNSNDPRVNLPEACLFIASLSSSVSPHQLNNTLTHHFSQWGPLTNVKVLKDWLARPYAFVQFENEVDAKNALQRAHNTIVCGRYIRVEQAKVNRTLFLGKFGGASHEQLKTALETFGPVEDLNVLFDHRLGRSKGCGFVKFRFRDDAIKAFLGIRQKYPWTVEWAANLDRNKPEIDLSSLFIGQLNQNTVTEKLLRERFGQYGVIHSLELVNKLSGSGPESRPAFAFVTYEDESSAEKAIEKEVLSNAQAWLDRTIRVQYREIGEFKGLSRTMKRELMNVRAAPEKPFSTLPSSSLQTRPQMHHPIPQRPPQSFIKPAMPTPTRRTQSPIQTPTPPIAGTSRYSHQTPPPYFSTQTPFSPDQSNFQPNFPPPAGGASPLDTPFNPYQHQPVPNQFVPYYFPQYQKSYTTTTTTTSRTSPFPPAGGMSFSPPDPPSIVYYSKDPTVAPLPIPFTPRSAEMLLPLMTPQSMVSPYPSFFPDPEFPAGPTANATTPLSRRASLETTGMLWCTTLPKQKRPWSKRYWARKRSGLGGACLEACEGEDWERGQFDEGEFGGVEEGEGGGEELEVMSAVL